MQDEEWRPLDQDGWYEVSNQGRVRSWYKRGPWPGRREAPKILSQYVDPKGYFRVSIVRRGTTPWRPGVHQLVAQAFHGHYQNLQVRHLDGDKTNNRPENLAWGTPAENSADSVAHGTNPRGERHGCAILTEDDVRAIRAATGTQAEIAARFGVSKSTVGHIRTRRTWKHIK